MSPASLARAHGAKAAVVALPLLLALASSAWLTSSIGDADCWVYNGYFKALSAFAADRAAWGPPQYFETRLPIIVPGAIVYGLLPDAAARVVLNVCILHGITALSFWYVVRTHLSARAATATTILLVTDVFYLRTIGWDYVDNAVLAYQALTFALLTRAGVRADPRRSLAGAGFAATSMLTVHFGSALMLPIFAIYSLAVVQPLGAAADLRRRVLRLVLWAGLGGAVCLVGYGLVSLALHGPFAYWLPQLQAGQAVTPARWAGKLGVLAASGYWLTLHAAVLVAAVLALAWSRRKTGAPLPRLATFCLGTTSVLYLLLVIGEGLKRSYYLNRAGLYASSFLLLSYLTVAVLLFGRRETRSWTVWLVAALYPALLLAKMTTRIGAAAPPLPMAVIAAVMAAALFVAFATEAQAVLAAALVVLGLGSFLVRWPFERDDTIVAARNYILDDGAFPRVFYEEREPQRNIFVSILAALTDHAMADHYTGQRRAIAPGDRIAILDSQIPADPAAPVPCAIAGLRPLGSRQFDRRYLSFRVHRFEAEAAVPLADIRCPAPVEPDRALARLLHVQASALAPGVGERRGDVVAASEPTAPPGPLVRGPFITLPAGIYRVTFEYAAVQPPGSRLHRWTLGGLEDGVPRLVAEGLLPGTEGKPGTLSATFRLPVAMDRFEATSWFGGTGELTLSAVTIEQRLAPKE